MKRAPLKLLLLLVCLAMVAVACGDTAETTTTTSAATTTTSGGATTTTAGETTTTSGGATTTTAAGTTTTAPPVSAPLLRVVRSDTGVDTLDIHRTNRASSRSLGTLIFNALIGRDPVTGEIIPELATSWEWVSDTVAELTLRDGVMFSNGEPFNADVAVWNIERILDEENPGAQRVLLSNVASVEAPDATTLRFNMTAPEPGLFDILVRVQVIPMEYGSTATEEQLAAEPIGTGPYVLDEWDTATETFTFTRRDDYWGDEVAAYEQIEVRWIDELATAQSELLAGTADIIDTVSADAFDLIENSGVARLESTQNMVTADYALDMLARSGPTPFEVKEVRQAVNYAVDWQAIIDAFYGGAGTRQATPVHPAMYGYDETIEPYPYDPDMARELLLQAGYGDGFEIVIRWWGADLSRLISEVIAQYLADVGITATLEVIPDPQIGEVIRGGAAGPMFGVRQATHSGIFDAGYSWAFFTDGAALTYASSPELQNLIDTANAEIQDPARRLELLSELQAYAREEALSLYGFSPDAVRGVSNEVEFQPSPDALDRYATARPAG